MLQLKELYPDVTFLPVRGNIQTRLQKLQSGAYGALILAAAGLKRLDLENRIYRYFEPDEIIPAAGQGILAVQGRKGEDYAFLKAYNDPAAQTAQAAERAFVKYLNGGQFTDRCLCRNEKRKTSATWPVLPGSNRNI